MPAPLGAAGPGASRHSVPALPPWWGTPCSPVRQHLWKYLLARGAFTGPGGSSAMTPETVSDKVALKQCVNILPLSEHQGPHGSVREPSRSTRIKGFDRGVRRGCVGATSVCQSGARYQDRNVCTPRLRILYSWQLTSQIDSHVTTNSVDGICCDTFFMAKD